MKNKQSFHKFTELKQALKFMNKTGTQSKIIAGGTDVLIELRKEEGKLDTVKHIIDIHDIQELKNIEVGNEICSIGACCTFKEISSNEHIRSHFPLLKMAVEKIGSPQIRNVATIGGNICNLAACADSIAPLLVYDAQVRLCSEGSERTVHLEKILIKPYKAAVRPDEILTQIILPLPDNDWKYCFYKLGRRTGVSISRLSYAILLKISEDKVESIRFAFGALFSVPKRLHDLEQELKQQTISVELWKDVSRKVAQQILDETGVRWSTSYKIPVLQQLFFTSLMDLT
ncbi:MAG: xanthine dehydrogenase family protein subunit M [Candidatus Celaenobacter antarcticus]|nr:xanthine dehydrogenase family protein subunit M [Candidatus Celaenobacter antarcticus]